MRRRLSSPCHMCPWLHFNEQAHVDTRGLCMGPHARPHGALSSISERGIRSYRLLMAPSAGIYDCNSVKSGGPTSISQHKLKWFHGRNRTEVLVWSGYELHCWFDHECVLIKVSANHYRPLLNNNTFVHFGWIKWSSYSQSPAPRTTKFKIM
jgi:hypothetical protein